MLPPVKLTLDVVKYKIEVPVKTEPTVLPPLFPSMLIFPEL